MRKMGRNPNHDPLGLMKKLPPTEASSAMAGGPAARSGIYPPVAIFPFLSAGSTPVSDPFFLLVLLLLPLLLFSPGFLLTGLLKSAPWILSQVFLHGEDGCGAAHRLHSPLPGTGRRCQEGRSHSCSAHAGL